MMLASVCLSSAHTKVVGNNSVSNRKIRNNFIILAIFWRAKLRKNYMNTYNIPPHYLLLGIAGAICIIMYYRD